MTDMETHDNLNNFYTAQPRFSKEKKEIVDFHSVL